MSALAEEWWAAAAEGRLLVQRCGSCGHHQHHPRPFCLACRSTDVGFVEASGRGVVHSFTEVHRSPREDLEPGYVVALVDLEEGVRLLTWLVDPPPPGGWACDQPVRLTFTDDKPAFTNVG